MPRRHQSGRSTRDAVARVEELVLAGSGADAFELVFALAAAECAGLPAPSDARGLTRCIAEVRRRLPDLAVLRSVGSVPDAVVAEVGRLLAGATKGDAEALDAVFEGLVSRVGKGHKGQFFTPRHVVDLATRALLLEDGETVVDPACGSGAFLVHARACARVRARGMDVDERAVRVAKLMALATGGDPGGIARGDSLGSSPPRLAGAAPGRVDAIATNPPFAGRVCADGFELAGVVPKPERDALFLERCLGMLRPRGRLAIVLPHPKVAAPSWAPLRRWLVARARVYAVVSLPKETFLPHTSQRTALVFAKKRARGERSAEGERVFFAVSERAGKDAGGGPILRAGVARGGWRAVDHDLEGIAGALVSFLREEGFAG